MLLGMVEMTGFLCSKWTLVVACNNKEILDQLLNTVRLVIALICVVLLAWLARFGWPHSVPQTSCRSTDDQSVRCPATPDHSKSSNEKVSIAEYWYV